MEGSIFIVVETVLFGKLVVLGVGAIMVIMETPTSTNGTLKNTEGSS